MTYTITQFGSDTTPALLDLDQNFNAAFLLTPVPCSVSGTDVLALTQNAVGQAASGTIAAYANGLQICGVAVGTNTTVVTAALGALAALNVYKDSVAGPIALAGGEIVLACAFTLRYDSALNSGAGGWHLIATTAQAGSTITPALVRASTGIQVGATTGPTLSGLLSSAATLVFTSIVPGSSQDQSFTVAGLTGTEGLAWNLPAPASVGIIFQGYANTSVCTVRAANFTSASTITPGTITVQLKGIRTA